MTPPEDGVPNPTWSSRLSWGFARSALRRSFHRSDRVEHGGQLRRKGRAHVERHAGSGPLEGHGVGVQERALQSMTLQLGIPFAIAILVVAQQRMSGESGMDTKLGRA